MKIVFATEGTRGLAENVSQHFGRCPTYTLVEVIDGQEPKVTVVENPTLANHGPGMAPEYIAGLGAEFMVTGGMGPKAIEFFASFGIRAVTGAYGPVKDMLVALLRQLSSGENAPEPAPCEEHQEH